MERGKWSEKKEKKKCFDFSIVTRQHAMEERDCKDLGSLHAVERDCKEEWRHLHTTRDSASMDAIRVVVRQHDLGEDVCDGPCSACKEYQGAHFLQAWT